MTSIGGLAITGDMGMILAACHTHGFSAHDGSGKNEGSYHVGGSVVRAVPDFSGRRIVAATTEGELLVLNRGGNVRWKTSPPATGCGDRRRCLGSIPDSGYGRRGDSSGSIWSRVERDDSRPARGEKPAPRVGSPSAPSSRFGSRVRRVWQGLPGECRSHRATTRPRPSSWRRSTILRASESRAEITASGSFW